MDEESDKDFNIPHNQMLGFSFLDDVRFCEFYTLKE